VTPISEVEPATHVLLDGLCQTAILATQTLKEKAATLAQLDGLELVVTPAKQISKVLTVIHVILDGLYQTATLARLISKEEVVILVRSILPSQIAILARVIWQELNATLA
jgi:hypothetical protein